jgi:hypothetical protein
MRWEIMRPYLWGMIMQQNANPTGIYLPNNVIQDTSDFEPSAPTSRIGGFALSAAESLASAPTLDIGRHLQEGLTQELSPGKFLNAQQYKESPYFREGLNFPQGISENVAKLRAQEFDQNQATQSILDNMPAGALSGISDFTGNLVGAALDPINLAGGFAAEATIGAHAPQLLAKLSEAPALAQRATQVGVGATEGAAISTPQAISQYDTEQQLGEDPTPLSLLATIGLGAGLGGAIRGAVGFHSPITVESDRIAKQTAVNQLASGKSVHVDEILQNGQFQAQQSTPEIPPEQLEVARNQLVSELDNTNKAITDEQTNLDNLTVKQQTSDTINPASTATTGENIMDTISSILQKPTVLRDASDISFLNSLPKTDEVQNLVSALGKPAFLQDATDRTLIDTFRQGKEADLLQQRLNDHQANIDELQQQIANTPNNSARKLGDLQNQLQELSSKVDLGNQRLNELDNLGKEPKPIRESRERINQLRTQKSKLEDQLYKHDAITDLQKTQAQPVSLNQLRNASNNLHDYRSDSAINEVQDKAFTDELKGMPDEPQRDFQREEAQVKQLEEAGAINKDDQATLDKVRDYDHQLSIFEKAIKNAANCLKGLKS